MTSIGLGRISSLQRFNRGNDYLVNNQSNFAQHTLRMNSGQRLLHNYDQIGGAKELIDVTGKLAHREQLVANYSKAATELDLADSSLANIKNVLDQIKSDALQGSNDTVGPGDLEVLGNQLRNLGENIYQLANTKIGNKFVFGGAQSDKAVITHSPGALFANAIYKENAVDQGERYVEGLQASVSLSDLFNTSSQPAQVDSAPFVTLAANSEINLVVNDGVNDYNLGDIPLLAGDSVTVVATKINAAFTAAGGAGTIAQNSGGYLTLDTALVTGGSDNGDAAIIISEGSGLPGTLANIGGITAGTTKGVSKDLRQTLNELDSAYYSGDNSRVRAALVDLEVNINRLIKVQAKLGDFVSKFNEQSERNVLIAEQMEIDQADVARLPVVEAIEKVSAAQNVLGATMQSAAAVMRQTVFDFVQP